MLPNSKGDPSRAALTAADVDSTTAWYAILHPPRHIWVKCCECGYSAVNELNMLRRAGWSETAVTPRRYRCGDCSEAVR